MKLDLEDRILIVLFARNYVGRNASALSNGENLGATETAVSQALDSLWHRNLVAISEWRFRTPLWTITPLGVEQIKNVLMRAVNSPMEVAA